MGKNTNESIAFRGQSIKKLAILWVILFGFILATAVQTLATVEIKAPTKIPPVDRKAILQKIFKVQVPFIVNQGQIKNKHVQYYARTFGGTAFVTDQGEVIYLFSSADPQKKDAKSLPKTKQVKGWILKEILVGAAIKTLQGTDRSQTKINYFIGNDRNKWNADIPAYNIISLGQVYKGIELSLKAYGKNVEKIFNVSPGADPKAIRLKIEGARSIKINAQGELEVDTQLGVVCFSKPLAYQEKDGKQQKVQIAYHLNVDTYGFIASQYDKSRPLIIDPYLSYSAIVGGDASDSAHDIAIDTSGNAYITGQTLSSDPAVFPTTPGAPQSSNAGGWDAFIAKINSSGTALTYATYIGGSGTDTAWGIDVDDAGNAYVIGRTSSSIDFPILPVPGAFQDSYGGGTFDAFVTKIDSSGSSLVYSTYLGGGGHDDGGKIAVDSSGYAYATGYTDSDPFPTTSGAFKGPPRPGGSYDGFVTKINPSGTSLVYSTYLGGIDTDTPADIAIDDLGNAYVTGLTGSSGLGTPGAYRSTFIYNGDAFVAKLNSDGSSLDYFTYFGSVMHDSGHGIAVDGENTVYICGETDAGAADNFPTRNAYQLSNAGGVDAFVAKLQLAGSGDSDLIYSTFLGSDGPDYPKGIAVGPQGYAYVIGYTEPLTAFPSTHGALQPSNNLSYDVFISRLSADGSRLLYSTVLGGGADDQGYGIAVASASEVYVAGFAATFTGNPFPSTFQAGTPGTGDAFVAKITIPVWYVRPGGAGNQDGTSWDHAFATIQEAVDAADEDEEIWVMEGTYSLTTSIQVNNSDVHIYGGFPDDVAIPDPQWSDRDWVTYETTIDGQNSRMCIDIGYLITATIDGLIIVNGNAASGLQRGGGIYINNNESTISNCKFVNNTAGTHGGAIYIEGGGIPVDIYPKIVNCDFNSNSSSASGGAIYSWESYPILTNCIFDSNSADLLGGAIYLWDSKATINNCDFTSNSADVAGAIYNDNDRNSVITDSTFRGNSSTQDGGAIYNEDSAPTFTSCSFLNNNAFFDGAGILNYFSPAIIANCIFVENNADENGAGIYNDNSPVTIINSTFSRNWADIVGGAIYNDSSNITIFNSILWGNTASGASEIYNLSSTPVIYNSDIEGSFPLGSWDSGLGTNGGNNIDGDPIFISPALDDLRLQYSSPCKNAGENTVTIGYGIVTDFEGEQRISNIIVDIGADEFFDSDTDQLPDSWEFEYFGDLSWDGANDPDGDGLNNAQEIQYGTNPDNPDTDGDGYSDGREVARGSLPLDDASYSGVPDAEWNALVDLYNHTNGGSWFNTVATDRVWEVLDPASNECAWYGVTCDGPQNNVWEIDLHSNNLVGTMPASIENLRELQILRLHTNQLSGTIPPELGNLDYLTHLVLSSNQLTGGLPFVSGDLPNLEGLWLSVNQLTGTIDPVLNLTNLRGLYMANNQFSGSIPTGLENLTEIRTINLAYNQLSGSIPPVIGNLSYFYTLQLNDNQLTGPIPAELGNLTNLEGLFLYNNRLSGSIPAELGDLTQLRRLNLDNNQLSGQVPAELGNLTLLEELRFAGNMLTGPIPSEFADLGTPSLILYISYNALYLSEPIDPVLEAFLNSRQPTWADTQTVAPENLSVNVLSPTSVELTWTPITYTGNSGGYEIWKGLAGDPASWTLEHTTPDKNSSSYTVMGLTPGDNNVFRVRTVTNPHSGNQNTVYSEFPTDADGDGVPDDIDNCQNDYNPGQDDIDTDGIGSVCDPCPNDAGNDPDGDGLCWMEEIALGTSNSNTDSDGDGVEDGDDYFPADVTEWADFDGDGIGDNGDNCPERDNGKVTYNTGDSIGECATNPLVYLLDGDGNWQPDYDCDGIGDDCDNDADDDGYDSSPEGDDCDDLNENNYPGCTDPSADCPCDGQISSETPGNGNCNPNQDCDGDGVEEKNDNCPGLANDQADGDGDSKGDLCDNCPTVANADQTVPVWYKDHDLDGYYNGDTVTQCERPIPNIDYKSEDELAGYPDPPEVDCDDNDNSIYPGNTDVNSNCDPSDDTVSEGDYNIQVVLERCMTDDCSSTITLTYGNWAPQDGDHLRATFKAFNGETEFSYSTDPNVAPRMNTNFVLGYAVLSSGGPNPSRLRGKYLNDTSENGIANPADDFDNISFGTNQVRFTCRDFGGSLTIHAEVPITKEDGITIETLSGDFAFPKDTDGDGLPDFWESPKGNLLPDADPDLDGIPTSGEYRGVRWGMTVPLSADYTVYDTDAWVPEATPDGSVKHFRLDPQNHRDLFVLFEGFDARFPFAVGAAFENLPSKVAVHALGTNLGGSLGQNNIDVTTVTLVNGVLGLENDNIDRWTTRSWTFSTLGKSIFGGDDYYGSYCRVFRKSLAAFFDDKPHYDYTTCDGCSKNQKKVQSNWDINPSGKMESIIYVEDANDNGNPDVREDVTGNNRLDGDYPVRIDLVDPDLAYTEKGIMPPTTDADIDGDGIDEEWDNRFDLSPFDIDKSGMVELPVVSTPIEIETLTENSEAQAAKMIITHELGHNVGITIHTSDSTCAMNNESNNLIRDNHFSQDAAALVRIHNAPYQP